MQIRDYGVMVKSREEPVPDAVIESPSCEEMTVPSFQSTSQDHTATSDRSTMHVLFQSFCPKVAHKFLLVVSLSMYGQRLASYFVFY